MLFFSFSPGLSTTMRACSVRVLGSTPAKRRKFSRGKYARIRIGLTDYVVADFYVSEIALVHVREHPDRAHIRNDECLRGPGLQQLPGRQHRARPLRRRSARAAEFRTKLAIFQFFRLLGSLGFSARSRGIQVRLRLVTVGFRLQQVAFGDGVMRV